MIPLLLQLTVRGALMFALVAGLDRLFGARLRAGSRRAAWLLVPAAFLLLVPLPILPSAPFPALISRAAAAQVGAPATGADGQSVAPDPAHAGAAVSPFLLAWAAGAAGYLVVAIVRTRSALRCWGRERLCTDARLLGALEDCKSDAGIRAPIGLVISDAVAAPVILGWLRPRILLPAELAAELPPGQLRAVLFHELAHFHALDIPLNWLFTAVCALHWFNPAAHLAFRAWGRFCEEAADETAIDWLRQPSGQPYGETLLRILRHANGRAPAPYAALAIVESLSHLKTRLTMINNYEAKSPRRLLAAATLAVLALGIFLHPVRAADALVTDDPQAVANGAMQTWLQEIDDSKYEQSWSDAAPAFQKAITAKGWEDALTKVRTPLGKCKARKLASASHQAKLPSPTGAADGDFILAQFDTSFDGLAYAVETVTFAKAPDGSWKAAGYYIKARP